MVKTTCAFFALIFLVSPLYGDSSYQTFFKDEVRKAYDLYFGVDAYSDFEKQGKVEELDGLNKEEFVDAFVKAHQEYVDECKKVCWPEPIIKKLENIHQAIEHLSQVRDWRYEIQDTLVEIGLGLGGMIVFMLVFHEVLI